MSKGILAVVIVVIVVCICWIVLPYRPVWTKPCSFYKDIYYASFSSAKIFSTEVGQLQKNINTISINDNNGNIYVLMFFPRDHDDFDRLHVGDVLSKSPNNLDFNVNNSFVFSIDPACKE